LSTEVSKYMRSFFIAMSQSVAGHYSRPRVAVNIGRLGHRRVSTTYFGRG
jgi:hypothetical protein